ncbi:nucleoside hydrolase [Fodinicola feengrottensis]|uniref:nucleoside hydrolase n=1 Tax=Fodinicola feengrottensis TaxID=435914 RepID=UPI0013CF986A|nr:nucleoside hydrolase [Fodinicola feengrottensis]
MPPATGSAPQLIAAAALSSSTPVTVLATGPLSNVAAALRIAGVAAKISRLYAMGGAFTVPGNLFGSTVGGFDNTQEANMWVDPAAPASVFGVMRRGSVRLVPLDATSHVPITPAYVDRLGGAARTDQARLVHSIVTQPDVASLITLGGLFWWDPLTAVSMLSYVDKTGDDPVTFQPQNISVTPPTGASAGRTTVSPAGAPQNVGSTADQAEFEQSFLDQLNGN